MRCLALSETVDLPGYRAALRRIDEQLESNPRVRDACEEHVAYVLGDRVGPDDARYHAALDYLRSELPYLVSTPEVLRVPSSVSCYHALLPVVEELYDEGTCFHPGQGHVVLRPRDLGEPAVSGAPDRGGTPSRQQCE